MTEPINMREPIWEICRRVGVDPEQVAELNLTPAVLTVTVFKRNDNHRFYVEDDGEIAKEVLTFEINSFEKVTA